MRRQSGLRVTIGILAIALLSMLSSAVLADGPRLKFKGKGPVCMCSGDALSEEDIRRAAEARKSRRDWIQQQNRKNMKEVNDSDESKTQE